MGTQVELLLEWSAEGGYNWSAAVPGPQGITPLHLAVLLRDGGALVEALTGGTPPRPWRRRGSCCSTDTQA